MHQTEKVTTGYAGVARYARKGTFPFQRGLSPDGAGQQPRQESVGGAPRQQELLGQLLGRHGGNDQISVQVMGSPTS